MELYGDARSVICGVIPSHVEKDMFRRVNGSINSISFSPGLLSKVDSGQDPCVSRTDSRYTRKARIQAVSLSKDAESLSDVRQQAV